MIKPAQAMPAIEDILTSLDQLGFWTGEAGLSADDPVAVLRSLMTGLGTPYIPDGCAPGDPIIKTAPSRRKSAAPFDRPEAIGWHGDFASHDERPGISLVHIARTDPGKPGAGSWRLASNSKVLGRMAEREDGRQAIALLQHEVLPFSYSDDQAPRWFRVIDHNPSGGTGLRFYAPSIERGYRYLGQEPPACVLQALEQIRAAADAVQVVVQASRGSLLVIDNWRALHDRTPQTVARKLPRQAFLGFVNVTMQDGP